MHEKTYENVQVCSDGMGSQFRSRYVFKLLASYVLPGKTHSSYYNERHHGKCPMDGIGGAVKSIIFRKVKSGQFSEAVTKFVPLILSVYLPENETVVEAEGISKARKIDQTLGIHKLERNCMTILISIFFKIPDNEDPFQVQWYGGENEIVYGHVETSESDDECVKCHGSYNESEEWLCCYICHQWYHEETVFMRNLSHTVIFLDYINRLGYLLVTCYIYG